MTIAKNILDIIDTAVKGCIGNPEPEVVLMDLYWEFWDELKNRKGTSSGFTGLSEYLIFNYVRFSLEERLNDKFSVSEHPSETHCFRSNNIVLTHDIDIRSLNPKLPKQRPDIALFVDKAGHLCLLGVVEIKVYISDRTILSREMQKFKDLAINTEALVFPVLFNVQYQIEFNALIDEYPDRIWVVSKANTYKNRMHLDEAVNLLWKVVQNRSVI